MFNFWEGRYRWPANALVYSVIALVLVTLVNGVFFN
jgi:hypothetical protein